jgi:hypothetical protein
MPRVSVRDHVLWQRALLNKGRIILSGCNAHWHAPPSAASGCLCSSLTQPQVLQPSAWRVQHPTSHQSSASFAFLALRV